ncbi:hypothetical protein PCE1_000984 [Barthelona sp. PCE]
MRKTVIGGNWKCTGTKQSVKDLTEAFNAYEIPEGVEVIIGAPFLHLPYLIENLKPEIKVAAENCSKYGYGAYTGSINPEMLVDFGLEWVILGHSERRHVFGETDAILAEKTRAALDNGLNVVFCIGELEEEFRAGKTNEVCGRQLDAILPVVKPEEWGKIIIAAEPVYAIGTGIVPTDEQIVKTHAFIREWFAEKVSQEVADEIVIQYGGSVKPANCEHLATLAGVDGFLVGGASTKASFTDIIASGVTINAQKQ